MVGPDYYIHRVALSGRYNDSYSDIAHNWDLHDLMKALLWIDVYEELERDEMNKSKQKGK